MHIAPGSTGVVILAPFGYEAMASHKSMHGLANNLAAAGMPVLRFDYPGTGDATGNETDRELLASRCKAASDACSFLREQGNVEQIVLIGLRLGASVAAIAAGACQVRELVLIEPIVSGGEWLQQLETLHDLARISKPETRRRLPGGVQEFLGHGMSLASHKAIEALDVTEARLPADCRILMLASDHSPGAQSLAKLWREAGQAIDIRNFDGFSDMMLDPSVAKPPMASLDPVVAWLERLAGPARPVAFRLEAVSLSGRDYNERPLFFGDDEPRFGVLCRPAGLRKAGPALILVNNGGAPHTGWGRQSVELARHLAMNGYVSFRIDSSGVGETPGIAGRPERLFYSKESCDDLVAAIDWLEDQGFSRPAVVGVGSGAHLALHAAGIDDRISGIQLINLQKFNWSQRDTVALYRSKDLVPPAVSGVAGSGTIISGLCALFGRKRDKTRLNSGLGRADLEEPQTHDALKAMKAILDRGVRVSIHYCNDDPGITEMNTHLGDRGRKLRDYQNFEVHIGDPARHTFDIAVDRNKLLRIVSGFAESLEVNRLRGLIRDQSNEPDILPGLGISSASLKKWNL